MILMSMALVSLLPLPLVFVYFLHTTLSSLKIKNKPTKKRINDQNDVICFRSNVIMSDCDCQINTKKPTVNNANKSIGDGLLLISVATTVRILYSLREAGVGQHNALLTSTWLAWFMSLPVWKMYFFDLMIKKTLYNKRVALIGKKTLIILSKTD